MLQTNYVDLNTLIRSLPRIWTAALLEVSLFNI